MRRSFAKPLALAAVVVAGLVGAGAGHPAGSAGDDIRIDDAAGTIEQDLPALAEEEPRDEAALEAESARVVDCLEAQGLTEVVSEFEFEGRSVQHKLIHSRAGTGLSDDEVIEVELRCTARLTVLIEAFAPSGTR